MNYSPDNNRYENAAYNFCGKSGLKLPALSLGLWHNFGDADGGDEALKMLCCAFDNGITHFDLANNYGMPRGSAEANFGKILKTHFATYRDEMLISTKAGHEAWAGPYGDGGSRKYMLTSLEQSLRRMQLDYVDIFYSHRYDPETPLEETMGALSDAVKQGKALYVGLSKYPKDKAEEAVAILKNNAVPCLIYQARYSIFAPEAEAEIFPFAKENGLGVIGFSPLAQGLLSDKYINGIPENSRAVKNGISLKPEHISAEKIEQIKCLNKIAVARGQSLAQMSLAWCLRKDEVNSVIIGASSVAQIKDNLLSLNNLSFSDEELQAIKNISLLQTL